MMEWKEAFGVLARRLADAVVVTGIGGQTQCFFASQPTSPTMYLAGPMGLAPSVGLGMALALPHRRVVVLEGDGAMAMALGCLTTIANRQPTNYLLVVVDNGTYESGGRNPTLNAGRTDFCALARAAGFPFTLQAKDAAALTQALDRALADPGPGLLWVPIAPQGSLPGTSPFPYEVRYEFKARLKALEPDRALP
ncbi:MAG: sulfopyruvate decarboxylase subunit beta [Deltaproteobacteria bacterium]|nr:sulfopyruvate decarboxylase subunit beta [Deltaproteobacteria bacterium]MBI3079375.1 sulfopyruvate decarboxylase subunit beta [Deltaproteobacteria bacterium]